MKFYVTQFISDYVKAGDEWKPVEVKNTFTVYNYDDLQNLLLTLIDFGGGKLKFEVTKASEEVTG